jgi:hypothetical protein
VTGSAGLQVSGFAGKAAGLWPGGSGRQSAPLRSAASLGPASATALPKAAPAGLVRRVRLPRAANRRWPGLPPSPFEYVREGGLRRWVPPPPASPPIWPLRGQRVGIGWGRPPSPPVFSERRLRHRRRSQQSPALEKSGPTDRQSRGSRRHKSGYRRKATALAGKTAAGPGIEKPHKIQPLRKSANENMKSKNQPATTAAAPQQQPTHATRPAADNRHRPQPPHTARNSQKQSRTKQAIAKSQKRRDRRNIPPARPVVGFGCVRAADARTTWAGNQVKPSHERSPHSRNRVRRLYSSVSA